MSLQSSGIVSLSIRTFFAQWVGSEENLIPPWITALILVSASITGYILLNRLLMLYGKKRSDHHFMVVWRKIKNPVLGAIILLDIIILKGLFSYEKPVADTLNHLVSLAIIFCISWLSIRAVRSARELIMRSLDMDSSDNLKARKAYTQLRVMERVIVFLIILLAIAVSLMTFEEIRRIGISLFASAGVAGIIIGFAAQKLLGSLLAGFQIALTQPIRIDDVVVVEGEWGWIEEINLTYVVVRLWDKRRLIVPTTYFIEKPFQNWTRASAELLGSVYIYADYRLPVEKFRQAFLGFLDESGLWDGKVGVMQVTGASETGIEIRVLMSAEDSSAAWDLRVWMREKLIGYLQEHFPDSLARTRVEMEAQPGK